MKREMTIEFFNKNYYQLNVGIKSKEEEDRKINMMIDEYLLENPNYNPSNFIISSDETETGDTVFDEEYEIEYTFIKNRWLPVYKSEEKKNKFFRAKLESLFRGSDDSVFRKYELKFTRQNASLLNVEIKTPEELKGLNFYIREDTDLTEFISEKVKDPFKYIRADQFNILEENIKNNIIINIAHIDYLNEEFKKDEADGRYIDKYDSVEKRIKKWFLEIDDFDMVFEREIEKLNEISSFPNKKDELKSQELIMMYNQMQDTVYYYEEIRKNYFNNKKECLNNNYVKLLNKSIYSIEVDSVEYRIQPFNLDDRLAEFEIISPIEYKGLIIVLRHIPVFVLSLTSVRSYFDSGRLTRYGKSELELMIKHKQFYNSGRYRNDLLELTNDKSSDFDRFKYLYKKIFETSNSFKLENPDEKDDKYLFIINEFYNKYADLVSREYSNILKKDLKTSFPSSYNVPDAKKSSTTDSDSFFDEFRYFFLARLVKKYSPLNKLPVPKGAMIIGNHKINIK